MCFVTTSALHRVWMTQAGPDDTLQTTVNHVLAALHAAGGSVVDLTYAVAPVERTVSRMICVVSISKDPIDLPAPAVR
jgi:hypothetical protein